jgi:hypothetical protein
MYQPNGQFYKICSAVVIIIFLVNAIGASPAAAAPGAQAEGAATAKTSLSIIDRLRSWLQVDHDESQPTETATPEPTSTPESTEEPVETPVPTESATPTEERDTYTQPDGQFANRRFVLPVLRFFRIA